MSSFVYYTHVIDDVFDDFFQIASAEESLEFHLNSVNYRRR